MKEHLCPVEKALITYEGECNWCGESEGPFAWFRYQQGSRVYYDTKKWDDCQPLYTHSDYERGFIDGMQKQMQSSVDKAVNRMAQPEQEPVAYWKEHAQGLQRDYDSLLADFQAQRTWVGLTDEDISEIVRGTHNTVSFVRAIEVKLREKNSQHKEKNT